MRRTFNWASAASSSSPARDEARHAARTSGEPLFASGRWRAADAPDARGVPPVMNVGVLVSGSGTNLQALIDRSARNELGPARLTVVGCNVPDCPALSRARLAGLPTFMVDHRDHGDRAAFDRRWSRRCARIRSIWWCWPDSCACSRASCSTPSRAASSTSTPPSCRRSPACTGSGRPTTPPSRSPAARFTSSIGASTPAPSSPRPPCSFRTTTTTRRCGPASWRREHELLPRVLQWIAEGRVTVEPPSPGATRGRVRVRGAETTFGVEPS